jgi:hypothetical protein
MSDVINQALLLTSYTLISLIHRHHVTTLAVPRGVKVKVKLSLCLTKHHTTRRIGGVEV